MNAKILLASAALALTAFAGAADAASTAYSSEAAFAAATYGDTVYGFGGVAPAGSYVSVGTSFTQGPLSFTSLDMFVFDGAAGFGLYGPSFLSSQYGSPNSTTISLGGAMAIGLHFGSYYNAGDTLAFHLSDGSIFTASLPGSQSIEKFIGFTSSSPITSIDVINQSGGIVTDFIDVTLGSAVPEPAVWALMLSGVGIAGAALRRRRSLVAV